MRNPNIDGYLKEIDITLSKVIAETTMTLSFQDIKTVQAFIEDYARFKSFVNRTLDRQAASGE